MKNTENQHERLAISKKDLKENIQQRLSSGNELSSREINTNEEKKDWWNDFARWDEYNFELIKQAFDKPDNNHALNYKGLVSGHYKAIYDRRTGAVTLEKSVQRLKQTVSDQLNKLQRFYEKIDLFNDSYILSVKDNAQIQSELLTTILSKFHTVAQELKERRENRETLLIKDEYDVQDLLNALLHLHFDDVRKEDASPSNAGGNSRLDFVLKKEKIIIEVKMTSSRLKAKELGEELLIDIGRYKAYPECNHLVLFIYDKDDFIRNKKGFIADLESQSVTEWKVTVIISPNW